MIFKSYTIDVPEWISTRSYFFGKENSRTYINNEKNHILLQLDGLSSDFWSLIVDDNSINFEAFIKENNLESFVDDFLIQLIKQGLLIVKNFSLESNNYQNNTNELKTANEDYTKLIEERTKWLYENKFMSSLFLELTYKCNLKCIHCYNPKDMSSIEIPFDKAKEIIDDAYDLGVFSITLSGGESTTYSHFLDLVKYIRKKRLSVEIFTNGQKLANDSELYKELISLYPYRICLSLYSDKQPRHDYVTSVNGSFDKTLSVIQQLSQDNISIQIKNFLLNFACHDCKYVKEIAKRINANCITDISLIPTIDGNKKTYEYVIDEDNLFKEFIDQDSPLYVGESPYLREFEKIKDETLCFGGFSGLCISPKLEVHICVSLPINLGNLNNTSIKEIWKDSFDDNKNSELKKWHHTKISDLKECYKYDYCKFCSYCAGMGYLENGFLKKSNVLCIQARAKKRAYEYIQKNKEKFCLESKTNNETCK